MLNLASETSPAWVDRVLTDVDTLLIDHAHCEKKAAGVALSLLFKLEDHPDIARQLSEVAREELEHFEQVLGLLTARDVPFRHLRAAPYAGELRAACRKGEPDGLIDMLLCCALIEARSCERMKLLAAALLPVDPDLAGFYRSLLESEARHHMLYMRLAERLAPNHGVWSRLAELAALEASIIAREPTDVRMHS